MRTIVMTGGTSGFGAVTSARIAATPDTRLLLGARGTAPDGIESLPLDLVRLAGVRSFAEAVLERLGGAEIDALVLNAGTLNRDVDGRTSDGFETTFAVDHLAHYLLLRLLLGSLARGTEDQVWRVRAFPKPASREEIGLHCACTSGYSA